MEIPKASLNTQRLELIWQPLEVAAVHRLLQEFVWAEVPELRDSLKGLGGHIPQLPVRSPLDAADVNGGYGIAIIIQLQVT